ncbi:MAG: dienelactone hydrolase family protein [Firmicutes bacterium]|nr:dienelactone hydrolase family protein [Alicyclobacillaceae bacterium]MCL6496848.1 dienelactone hydrolase family protein [Bacillota bacterium]
MNRRIDETLEGVRVVGHLATRTDRGRQPGVLVMPAIHGLSPYVEAVADLLSQAGYAALVVDYYDGGGPPPLGSPEEVNRAVAALSDPLVLAKGRAAAQYLRHHPDVDGTRLGAIGFCIGGMYALQLACEPIDLLAAVDFYGMIRYDGLSAAKPVHPLDRVSDLGAPLLAHFGTEDHLIPLDHVDALHQALAAARKVFELYRYPGAGHAFHDWTRPGYRPVAAREAWQRTLAFLDWYLQGRR